MEEEDIKASLEKLEKLKIGKISGLGRISSELNKCGIVKLFDK